MIEQICKRLSYGGKHFAMHANIHTSSQFATDDLPFLKKIIPEEVSKFQGQIYQYSSRYVSLDGCGDVGVGNVKNINSNGLTDELEQQNAVLANDDIIDSSDSENDGDMAAAEDEEGLSIQQKSNNAVITSSQRSSVISQDSATLLGNHHVGKRRRRSDEDIIVID